MPSLPRRPIDATPVSPPTCGRRRDHLRSGRCVCSEVALPTYGAWPVMPLTVQPEPPLVRVNWRELSPLHWVPPAPGVALNA
jgi:hypothetical protein